MRVPVVGWMPLQSMEQMGPLFVLFLMHPRGTRESRKRALSERDFRAYLKRLTRHGSSASAVLLTVMVQSGKIGGLSARVRGLFVPHTRTGNPLVDSVAEHQATQGDVYAQYFHFTVVAAPVGALACAFGKRRREPARLFVALYFIVAGYFSSKMVRLVLLLGPAAAAATASVGLGAVVESGSPTRRRRWPRSPTNPPAPAPSGKESPRRVKARPPRAGAPIAARIRRAE